MVFDGNGHPVAQPFVAGVITAHNALKLGKFAHHAGQQVGLGQASGLLRLAVEYVKVLLVVCGIGHLGHAQLVDNGVGHLPHTLAALPLRAQFVVVHHFGQTAHAAFQRFFAVLVEKELSIGQTRAHHALVAADHGAGIGRPDVADHQEPVGEFSGGIEQRKIFLVGLHRQNQALLRHVQKLLLELAHQHVGALDQRSHLIQQRIVFNRVQAVVQGFGRGLELAGDFAAAFVKTGNDAAFFAQVNGVIIRTGKLNGIACGLKPVPVGGTAGLEPQHTHRHYGFPMQRHQPMCRPHELHAAPAGQFTPLMQLVGHDLGNGQFRKGVIQGFLQARIQCGAGYQRIQNQHFGLSVHHALDVRHNRWIGPHGLQFFQQRRRGVSASVQRHARRHELLAHGLVCRLGRHMGDVRRQPPRAGKGRNPGIWRSQALHLQLIAEMGGKDLAQFFQRLGRQFFHKQFNKQVLGGHGSCQMNELGYCAAKGKVSRHCSCNSVRYSGRLRAIP